MKSYSSLTTCLLLLILAALFILGCSSDRTESGFSGFPEQETTAGSDPLNENSPEENQSDLFAQRSGARTGIIRKEGDFWIGLPSKGNAMILLKLSPDTEIKVLDLVEGYYKVEHRQVYGYVEKSIIEIVEPTEAPKAKFIPAPEERESVASEKEQARTPARLAKNEEPVLTPCTGKSSEELLPGVSCAQYWAKVQEKVSTLESYIQRIIDKSEVNRQKSIDLACRLFVNEQAKVFTSSGSEGTRSRPIRKYLNSLMTLNYDKVEIEWTNIQYVSELRKGPDGRYYGNVHIEQKFEGFMDGRLVYGDVTEKTITIVLESYEVIDAQGDANTRWDVFLSDIGVEQTQTI